MKCADCGHAAHKPGRCPFDNCGESEMSHPKSIPQPSAEKHSPRETISSLRPLMDKGRGVKKKRTDS